MSNAHRRHNFRSSRRYVSLVALCWCGLLLAPIAATAAAPTLEWTRQFGSTGADFQYDVAANSAGNVYITGRTTGSLGGANAGGDDAFLVKYDSAGNSLWSRQLGTSSGDEAHGVAVDAAGYAYVIGDTGGSLFGPNPGAADAFLAKYDPVGNLVWGRQVGTTDGEYASASGVGVDGSGNIFMGGLTVGSLFGTHSPGLSFGDAFLAKYDAAGNQLWARQPVTSDHETEVRLAVDRAGNAYISNRRTQVHGGNLDIFLTKYDAAGSLQWTKQFAADETLDFVTGLSADNLGNIYMAGQGLDASSGVTTGTVAKYDASGDISWTRQFAVSRVFDISTDATGNSYIAWYDQGGVNVTKYDPSGELLWSQNLGAGTVGPASVASGGGGNFFIGGIVRGIDIDPFVAKYSEAVPEPSAWALLALGLLSLPVWLRLSRRVRGTRQIS